MAELLTLQETFGNRAVGQVVSAGYGAAPQVSLSGKAWGDDDGGQQGARLEGTPVQALRLSRRAAVPPGGLRAHFAATACGRDAVTEAARADAQMMHDEAAQRSFNVDALPLAIDPFVWPIDLDC